MTRNEPLTWVGVAGFEPAASSSRTKRAAKLRYTPATATQSSGRCAVPRSADPGDQGQQRGFGAAQEPERRPR
jgi:hypothetical protein